MLSRHWISIMSLVWVIGCSDSQEPETAQQPGASCGVGFGAAEGDVDHTPEAPDGCHWHVRPGADDQAALQTVLILAEHGATICLAAGTYELTRELSWTRHSLTLRGAGREETVLDFSGQVLGANGIHITGEDPTVKALTVRDTAGDGVRATGVTNVAFEEVGVIWTADASPDNGAYGLYPVGCDGVRVERCLVKGASDAGIYVGQSFRILVKDNEVHGNVAGIEIENSTLANVTGNYAHGNTGGVLVFNLPNLPAGQGRLTKVHDNVIEENNLQNFAPPGNIVGKVPPGTGVLVLAADEVEIANNEIRGHRSLGIAIIQYDKSLFGNHSDDEFDPYSELNYVHDNVLEDNGGDPTGVATLLQEETLPSLAFSGCADPEKEHGPAGGNCFANNGDAGYLDFDQCGGFQNKSTDISAVTCEGKVLTIPEPCSARVGCVDPPPIEPPDPNATCEVPYLNLSDYGFFQGDSLAGLVPADGVLPYEVASPLWSDNSVKRRFIVLPEGAEGIPFEADGIWSFPPGTVLIKTFSYPEDLAQPDGPTRHVETRLLIHEEGGWTGHTYVWNEEQTEAVRQVAGSMTEVSYRQGGEQATHPYFVPSSLMCGSCHRSGGDVGPLGPMARQLAREVVRDGAPVDQLSWLDDQGLFFVPPPAEVAGHPNPYDPEAGDLDTRARAYLDANCAHCHRAGGQAEATGLFLRSTETNPTKLGICKPPVAAGSGSGHLKYGIVPGDPDASILVYRMASEDPAIRMPELPSLVIDQPGLQLIRGWIAAMDAVDCDEATE